MYFEREDKPKITLVILSIIFLSICLSFYYHFRGETGNNDSYRRLANLKSLQESGQLRTFYEPIPILLSLILKKISFSGYMVGYHISLAFSFSSFLHMIMLTFYRKEWKSNHYFIVYLTAFMPFSVHLPYYFYEEIICMFFLLLLNYTFKLETISDLFVLFLLTVFAFLSHIAIFFSGYLLFVAFATFKKNQEKKSKPTVFFKKKNIAMRILIAYLFFFILTSVLISYFDFFGTSSFGFLFNSSFDVAYRFFPIFLALFIGQYLLRSEKELNTSGTTAVVVLLIVVSGYFTYNTNKDDLESLKRMDAEIQSLKGSGRLSNSTILHGSSLISNYLYYHSGENIVANRIGEFTEKDYFIVENLSGTERVYLDRKNIASNLYFFLDNNTVLLSWSLIERLRNEKENNDLKVVVTNHFETFPKGLTPHEKLNRSLNSIFGM